ncbi:zinc-binding dehydrogenase [Candidatus Gottesmanbacteria bacterium]|nr:zinc-binding dehydrogenase [Candidatus Gottesmanbacteria bacterium]
MKTKAAVLFQPGEPLRIEEVEIPKLKKGQVLVRMLSSGICRAQLNEVRGWKGEDKFLPHLLGHEGAGIVEETGSGVTKVKQGDYVVTSWIKGKGLDGGGTQYKLGKITVNAGPITTFCQRSVISENRLVKVPSQVPPHIAALLGCAVPTGAGIIFHTLKVKKGSSIAIFGAGGVGASVILAAKMRGCKVILAIDISEEKLQFARILGATHTSLFDNLKPFSLDYSIEASGNRKAMEKAIEIVNDHGQVVIAGNLKRGEKISLDPFELVKGKNIMGTWGGESEIDRDIPLYAEAYLEGKMKIDALLSKRIKLEKVNEALILMEKNKLLGRAVIDFT